MIDIDKIESIERGKCNFVQNKMADFMERKI